MKTMVTISLLALLACMVTATAGPAWVEDDEEDAGSLPGDAVDTRGTGELVLIVGDLGDIAAGSGLPDFEDMYLIRILDPENFSATTAFPPGFTQFDSRLYLFEAANGRVISGFGRLGNEDTGGPQPGRVARGDEVGACCCEDGTCEDDHTPGSCSEAGGEFQGGGTRCTTTSCPVGFGACCIDGQCQELTYIDCIESGGEFLGDGTSCDEFSCEQPVGACCVDGECLQLTEGECLEFGGEFLGEGAPCDPDPCVTAFGACCIEPDCFMMSDVDCADAGGIFLGDGTDCETDLCPDPEGSTMGNEPTDGGDPITEPGLYFLAISVTPREPTSGDGDPIFFFADPTEVSGPDGPGGDFPINAWQFEVPPGAGAGDLGGEYAILLSGVGFAHPSCPWDLDGDGYVNVSDLLQLLVSWGPCPVGEECPADFDDDGHVGLLDLLEMLSAWGQCPGEDTCPWDFTGDGIVDDADLGELLAHLGPCDDPGNCPWDLDGNGFVGLADIAILLVHYGPCP
jgi:hypothetical protein